MCKILHVSDFHVNVNYELAADKLGKLVLALQRSKIKIDLLVFTGDLIDARVIANECKDEIISKYQLFKDNEYSMEEFIDMLKSGEVPDDVLEEYNDRIDKKTEMAYQNATDIFEHFVSELKITDTDRIIVCAGNHDRLRKVSKEKSEFDCSTWSGDEVVDDFKYYNRFCQKLKIAMSHNTNMHSIGGINFLIINTNWKVPEDSRTNEMCINCSSIETIMNKMGDDFNQNVINNILIAHKPFDDICENAKLDYKEDYAGEPAVEKLKEKFRTYLFGDKHSYKASIKAQQNEFLCGAPLSSENITYNLIDFENNKGVIASRYIRWYRNDWNIAPIRETVQEIYENSYSHIKGISFELLTGSEKKSNNVKELIDKIEMSIIEKRFDSVSEMFAACCKCKERINTLKKDTKKLELDVNIFDWVSNLILLQNEYNHPLNIRGECSVGKSAFLGVQYLYMLYMFSRGKGTHIPMYFNLEYIISSNLSARGVGNTKNYKVVHEKCCKAFDEFFKKCMEIEKKYKYPICIFVDGLDQIDFLSRQRETIEMYICSKLESEIRNYNKFILAFNGYKFAKNISTTENISKWVMYINSVDVIEEGERSYRFRKLVESYALLNGIQDLQKREMIINNIMKYRKISLSLNFLSANFEILCNIDKDDLSWDVMNTYKKVIAKRVEKIFPDPRNRCVAEKVAFYIQEKSATFYDVNDELGKNEQIGYNDFCIIKNKPEIRQFLMASYYVSELQKYASQNRSIAEESVLHYFVTRDVAIMIRLLLNEKTGLVERFVKNHKEELVGHLYPLIAYLAGHSKGGDNSELVKELGQIKYKKSKKIYSMCNERSLRLAEIISSNELTGSFEYIYALMDEQKQRWFNRNYQLYYYEDRIQNPIVGKREIECVDFVEKGFDFHNCYLVLLSKLKYSFDLGKRYPLMEIDLFTLCDLLYSRIQDVEISDGSKEISFFYSDESSRSLSIITSIIGLLEEYTINTVKYNNKLLKTNRIFVYFSMMLDTFSAIRDLIIECNEKNVEKPYLSPVYNLEKIYRMKRMRMIGWDIDDNNVLSEENRIKLVNSTEDAKETLQEHILDSVYIAMFFLPQKWNEKNSKYKGQYSKEKIICILLLRELGKYKTYDYPPFCSDNLRLKSIEENARAQLLLLGAVDGLVNLEEYYELFEAETNANISSGDINLVISREISLIQREYKYYDLLAENKIAFQKERQQEFEKEFDKISSSIGINIQEQIIHKNPKFKKFFGTY